MKLLYEAPNTVEANMILHLLEQAGLTARIDGEYLQGGIGEIQAIGVVRVMVEENDYAEAQKIITKWDEKQPEQELTTQAIKKKHSFSTAIIGFVSGVAVMALYYSTPITVDGIDYDSDGRLDEKWKFVNNRLSKTEIDRNLDGKIDFIYIFDRKGIIKSLSSDDDFNGIFETEVYYDFGNPVRQKSDSTGDGFKDYKINFKYGLIEKITFLNPVSKKASKIQYYGPIKLKSAEVDTTGDGVLDTLYEYDYLEEIVKKSNN